MECLVRVHTISEPPVKWSIKTHFNDGNVSLIVKRCDISKGWNEPLLVSLQNKAGYTMKITIPDCSNNILQLPINPFIGLSFALPRSAWKIPPYIFQTWRNTEISPQMKAARQTFIDQENYKYICWDDQECFRFLLNEYGERYSNAYSLLVPGAYRADFWRYCVLYKFGGIYVDAKTSCLRPFDEILRSCDELVLVRDLPEVCLLNGFIACAPRHPLMKHAIDKCLENIESRYYGSSPLDITGPHMFGKAFCRFLGAPEDTLTLNPGFTNKIQMFGRTNDGKYIVSQEGERLLQKEYDGYYKNDVLVQYHYPTLWINKKVYRDQLDDPKS